MSVANIQGSRRFGDLLRHWRRQRAMSQMMLSLEAGISTRHLSFIENARAVPSREIILKIADSLRLDVATRDQLFLAAGLAPETFPEPSNPMLDMATAGRLLQAMNPSPAIALNEEWKVIAINEAMGRLLELLRLSPTVRPLDFLDLCLQPGGFASRVVNCGEFYLHLFGSATGRLRERRFGAGPDLMENVRKVLPANDIAIKGCGRLAMPVKLTVDRVAEPLEFISTLACFSCPDSDEARCVVLSFFPDNDIARALIGSGSIHRDIVLKIFDSV